MRTLRLSDFAAALLVLSATVPLAGADLASQLKARYRLTSVNAEGNIVNQGATLVLKRGGLVGGVNAICVNDYKNGKISMAGNLFRKGACSKGVGTVVKTFVAGSPDNATRPFVAGEKVYVTGIDVKDAVIFSLISDSISDVRYKADLAFLKGGSLELGPAQDAIGEVFKIESGGGTAAAKPAAAPAAVAPPPAYAPEPVAVAPVPPPVDAFAPIAPPPPAPVDVSRPAPRPVVTSAVPASPDSGAIAPIAPPPPPPDQPTAQPALSAGLTVDQVAAMLGQPSRIADLGAKKIYSYGNLKVTFVNDRVIDFRDSSKEPEPSPETGGFKLTTTTIVLIVAGAGVVLALLAVGAFLLLRPRGNKGAASAVKPPPPPPPSPTVRPLDPPAIPVQKTEPTPWPPARAVSLTAQPVPQPPVLPMSQTPVEPITQLMPQPQPIPQPMTQPISQPPVQPPALPVSQPTARQDEYKTLMELGIISAEEYEKESARRAAPVPPAIPPPMPAASGTIVLGQTEDQVMRILGQPQNVVDLGAKKIYVYPVLKVTFNDGKVADVH